MTINYTKIKYTIERLLSKMFWIHNRKIILMTIGAVVIIVLLLTILFGTEQNMGAKEVGVEVASLARNIRNAYKIRPDFWGLNSDTVINKGIYPRSMKTTDGKLLGYFDNEVLIGSDRRGTAVMPTMRRFVVTYKGLNHNQCVALSANAFNREFWLGVTALSIANPKYDETFEWGAQKGVLPLNKKTAKKLCQKRDNMVVFGFE